MRVKLLKEPSDSWLKYGVEYHVASIEIYEDNSRYRIYSEEKSPVLFDVDLFEIVSHHIPSIWQVHYDKDGRYFDFCPAGWAVDDFWVRYFDANPAEVEVFNAAMKIITSED